MWRLITILGHGFSLRAVVPLGVALTAGWATLWQLGKSVFDWDFWLYAGIMLAFTLLSWGLTAHDIWKNKQDDVERERRELRLQSAMDNLVQRSCLNIPSPVAIANFRENLKTASNKELRAQVTEICKQLRLFENTINSQRQKDLSLLDRRSDDPDAERNYYDGIEAGVRHGEQDTKNFNDQFRPAALALRSEMEGRLGVIPPRRNATNSDTALDYGVLSGISPVEDAAKQLEALVRRLED